MKYIHGPQRSSERGEDAEETGRERLPHSLPSGRTSVRRVPRRGWGVSPTTAEPLGFGVSLYPEPALS